MMNFRTLKKNLTDILGQAANGRFTVFGYQQQQIGASEVLGDKRRVQVFYDSGDFPKGKASPSSSTQHEITYRVELSVSAAAEGNLDVINNAASNAAQIGAAMDAIHNAASRADDSLDELFEIIYQILMDARNIDLCTDGPPYIVSDRWVGSMQKGETVPRGEYVILTGNIEFTCQAKEEVTGDVGVAAGDGPFNVTDDIDGDDNEQTGSTTG